MVGRERSMLAVASPMNGSPTLLERFRLMCLMRAFEDACAEGIGSGELRGELHLATGQEGIAAGMPGSLLPQDWVVSTHRSHLHAIVKGVPLYPLMAEIFEKADGLARGKGGHVHLFDLERRFSTTGIVGSSLPVAAGHAYAARLDGSDAIAVGVTGDGGANSGQFHETMNLAAIWSLPLVVLVENNGYGISVPTSEVVSGAGIAERASAYGAWGRRVDGTDVEAVAEVFAEAATHARGRNGPALLEATCFRFRGHYEGDVDHYRSDREKRVMLERGDPIAIARARLREGGAGAAELDELQQSAVQEVRDVRERVRAAPAPDPSAAFTDVFAGPP